MKANDTTCWGIASGKSLMPWTFASTRRAAIAKTEENWLREWKELRKVGCSAQKLRVKVIG